MASLLRRVSLYVGFLASIASQQFANETAFPDVEFFQAGLTVQGELGLRSPASPRQYTFVNYLDRQLSIIPGLKLEYDSFDLYKWQTNNDKSLFEAGSLYLSNSTGNRSIAVAGAIPFSAPTTVTGQLVYVPTPGNFSAYNVTGKIVIRDFSISGIPFSVLYSLVDLETGSTLR